jgi:hypothetical protein
VVDLPDWCGPLGPRGPRDRESDGGGDDAHLLPLIELCQYSALYTVASWGKYPLLHYQTRHRHPFQASLRRLRAAVLMPHRPLERKHAARV